MDAPSFTSKSWHAWSPPFKQKTQNERRYQTGTVSGALLPA